MYGFFSTTERRDMGQQPHVIAVRPAVPNNPAIMPWCDNKQERTENYSALTM